MNMHAQPQRTLAETALIDAFGERLSLLPGDGAVMVKRDDAIEAIKHGLPTRRVESWHYTDLRRLLTSVPVFEAGDIAKALDPVLDGSAVLPVLNGVSSAKAPEIEGVTVQRLSEKLTDGSIAPGLDRYGADDAIGALNTAFVADGYFVDIADGTELEKPIELQNLQAGGQTHVRLLARVGAGAKAIIVERQTGEGGEAALVSSVSQLVVGDGAEVTWLIVQEQPDTATHLAQLKAHIGKDAKLTLFVMNAGGKLVRQEVVVRTTGEGADFKLRGINLLAGDTHTDTTMVLDHAVPHTASTEVIRNVVTGKARGVFQGRINVHQYAQKTNAKMACNTLLLSDEGEFSTKPELEIFADDVVCGHGATVTEIDHNHLFYLMARGIEEKAARGLLVKAFVAEVIEELDDEALVDALEARLDAWFSTHG
ncbi:Fe-S cluster assembly protein SufD [Mesorhizobium sp. M1A.F.Ca.IN.022.07.1.1]|uniref:Fe-S cluster assembly protein SufD n=1 Tax=unclassified Mesorhizobium TaxID=325217 RepID=UPI000BAF7791|nr:MULTISPECIES: Fe-S cluster assembly protein SufD [unclassified Mesorhizobium]PBB30972.1 Fe-S cluster assembly protein SufD [Mesorhizobium sp. WSM3882]RUV05266.1 Fe-S cluster assembly protein SufD [Mesorhizobium sp. M1A.F.Ca.IN.020.03.2.1]RUV84405.1 Fe-S cluster assembly protein SufD [Mesorhizobium sp. M1A.F.Ca.IN.020.32.1.1]RUV89870.1 Fe-S cluster assembly protein SufD [Mesorhizobium sp. M1A.F.Ca.IN.022.07.1.1]RUW14472.1 Fe-S cluster assembly protein SufD [Mesorhizobium sp. M1A.F.Ca.IN.022.